MRLRTIVFMVAALSATQSHATPGPRAAAAIEKLTATRGALLRVRWHRLTGLPTSIAGLRLALSGATLRAKVKRFMSQYPGVLVASGSDLRFVDQRATHTRRVLRYQQRYRGVPVFRRYVTVAFDTRDRLVGAHMASAPVDLKEVEAKLDGTRAAQRAREALHGREASTRPSRHAARLMVLAEGKPRLVYTVRFPLSVDHRGRVHLVDARTGAYLGWRPGVRWERRSGMMARVRR